MIFREENVLPRPSRNALDQVPSRVGSIDLLDRLGIKTVEDRNADRRRLERKARLVAQAREVGRDAQQALGPRSLSTSD